jgi:hypothetical protein
MLHLRVRKNRAHGARRTPLEVEGRRDCNDLGVLSSLLDKAESSAGHGLERGFRERICQKTRELQRCISAQQGTQELHHGEVIRIG